MAAQTQAEDDAAQRAERDRAAAEGEAARDEVVIPVLRETIHIGKRRVESGRVRVTKPFPSGTKRWRSCSNGKI